jgi:GNAT superfamily N-acetyltransferase
VSTAAPAVTCRRASIQDASAVLSLARRFVSRSPFAQFVEYDEETTRGTILQALDRGIVFVLELPPEVDSYGTPKPPKVVGAIMGALMPLWFSRELTAIELGWWVDDDHRGHGSALRLKFEEWARQMRAPVVSMSDVVLDDATPAGTLYERAGYEMVERSWMKGLRVQG